MQRQGHPPMTLQGRYSFKLNLRPEVYCPRQIRQRYLRPVSRVTLGDFLQKWKVKCRADGLVPMLFAIFPLHLFKVLRLPRKNDARSYEVLHLSRKIILANLQSWCSKMQPLSGNQRPKLQASLMNMSLVLRLPRDMHLCRSSANLPRLPSFLEMPQVLLTFGKVHNPLRRPCELASERPKVDSLLVFGRINPRGGRGVPPVRWTVRGYLAVSNYQ